MSVNLFALLRPILKEIRYIAMPLTTKKMTHASRLDRFDQENVVSLVEDSLAVYAQVRKFLLGISHIMNHIVKMFAVVIGFVVIVIGVPTLLLLLIVLAVVVSFAVIQFNFGVKRSVATYLKMDRKDLINFHVRIKQMLMRLESLKNSKLLFSTPGLGWLLNTYLSDLHEFEEKLRFAAYPNFGKKPQNTKVHAYDPNSPWQNDTTDLIRI